MDTSVEERQLQFGEEYEDTAPAAVGELVISVGQLLEYLVGREPTNTAMVTLLSAALDREPAYPEDWLSSWRELSLVDLASLDASETLTSLYAYAYYGLPVSHDRDVHARAAAIMSHCTHVQSMLEMCPSNWADLAVIERTADAASVRQAMDMGEDDREITHEELAAIARVSVKSIRNLVAPSSGSEINASQNGRVRLRDARRWIQSRPNFKSSIWQLDEAAEIESEPSVPELHDVLFVPVAKDGSFFSLTCNWNGRYQIGGKGAEEKIEDFRQALDRLSRMASPRWRRQNAKGHWGIVTGITWARKTAAELGL